MDELALKDMENLLDLDPHLPEALALRDMLRMRIENKRVARDADALWEMKRVCMHIYLYSMSICVIAKYLAYRLGKH